MTDDADIINEYLSLSDEQKDIVRDFVSALLLKQRQEPCSRQSTA
jgi:hypothetical protein